MAVSSDVSGALSGLNAVQNQLGATTNAFRQAAPAALLFTGAAAAVGAGLVSAVNVASDFEHQMSGIKAVMAPTEVQRFSGALEDLALTLGRDTVFSSSQAAAGIEELIKAGIPAEDVLGGAANAALALAAATGIGVADAATVAATAMNTFGVQASALGNVVDVLAGTANASAADIGQLQFGLQAVGPVAAQMGLSLEDTAAALGIFANNGLRGQDAGTSLKTMLLNLIPSTKAQTSEFKKLGLITADGANVFFNAEGHLRNLADVSQILTDSLAGMSDAQRIAALQTLFGTDAVRAAAILYKTGGDAVNAFHEEVGKVSAADAAKVRLDNLQGALTNLGGSFERVQIQIGKLFLPVLRSAADLARQAVDAFGNMGPEMQRLVVFVGTGAAAFLGFIGAMVLLGAIIPPLLVSFGALNAILFANPIGLIVVAIGALVAAAVVAFNTNEDFRNSVLGLWDAFQNNLLPAIGATLGAIRDQLAPVVADVSDRFSAFVSVVGPQIVEFFSATLPAALAALGTQAATLQPLFNAFTGFLGAVFNLVTTLATTGSTALQGLFENVLVPGLQQLGAALTPLQPTLEAVGAALNPLVADLRTIGERMQPVTDFFTNLTAAINAASGAIAAFQLPGFLTPAGGAFGVAGGAPVAPTSFAPGAGGVGGTSIAGPLVGQVIVTNEADENRLIDKIASLLNDSAGRVVVPPDNSSHPTLLPSVT
ncbi:MAG TPA: phage tail tape measure protein [Vicinamibacterales bacterium]|nr:phage tail tape measure protein [Vicinamibacterales bacterium]